MTIEEEYEQTKIIELKNAKKAYEFAKLNIEGSNFYALENIVIGSQQPTLIIKFARDVKNANILKLEREIIKLTNPVLAYIFAREVKGARIGPLEDIVARSKSPYICLLFAKDIKGADKKRLLEVVKNRDKKVQKQNDEEISL